MTINLEKRLEVIGAHPFFVLLPNEAIEQLAAAMNEITVKKDEFIVTEGELVDQIYLIAKGEAEVLRTIKTQCKSFVLPIAVLYKGEAIGLSDEGFFSHDGKRTASVKALTKMKLLSMDVTKFTLFMQRQASLYPGFKTSAEGILKIHFIKQAAPFVALTSEEVQSLVRHVDKIKCDEGEILFREDDPSNLFYMILSGEIEIRRFNHDKTEYQDTKLQSSATFGEKSLLTDLPTNAVAKALTKCQLLTLESKLLRAIIQSHDTLQDKLKLYIQEHSYPQKKSDVTILEQEQPDGQIITVLKKSTEPYYYRLTEEGLFIWQEIDGKKKIGEVLELYKNKFHGENDLAEKIFAELLKFEFITFPEYSYIQSSQESFLKRWIKKLKG